MPLVSVSVSGLWFLPETRLANHQAPGMCRLHCNRRLAFGVFWTSAPGLSMNLQCDLTSAPGLSMNTVITITIITVITARIKTFRCVVCCVLVHQEAR